MNKIILEDCMMVINDNDMEKLRHKTFLITGASGMIASYISYVLKLESCELTSLVCIGFLLSVKRSTTF